MQILATIANALAQMDERDKDKFLAFSEGMAYMVDRKKDVNLCQQTKWADFFYAEKLHGL